MKKRTFRKFDKFKYGWLKDAKRFLVLLVIVFLIFRLVIGFSFVKGNSMEPTLHGGEIAVYTRIYSEYKKGDVVSVRIPSGEYYVKRVIAAEGDTIDIKNGRVYIDDEVINEPYTAGETDKKDGNIKYPYTLKEGQVFVMGDNREASMDSRSFGVVGKAQIKGKLLFCAGKFYVKKVY